MRLDSEYLNICNKTIFYERPAEICIENDMKLTQANLITITTYSILFVLSSICNSTMIAALCRKKAMEKSRIHKFMFHLNIADLIITFITIPLEIGWKSTVYWRIGDTACKIFQFLRPVGIYLSSFIIISLCIDRYYAIVHPIKIKYSRLRTRLLIASSWIFSFVCALPQFFVFSEKIHPKHRWYKQCLDFNFDSYLIDDQNLKSFYNLMFMFYQIFVSSITFFIPLIVIIFTHGCIIKKFIGKLNDKKISRNESDFDVSHSLFSQNRSNTIKRAKTKTLKLAFIIICWTPYYLISVWFWIDPQIFYKIDDRIYNFLFIFAVSNCLANPLVYGLTSIKTKRRLLRDKEIIKKKFSKESCYLRTTIRQESKSKIDTFI